ncbi:MAG: type II toxin-antitoxin system VapC family toxin [Acidobacteria bacterium]|nr:type II toxin-antitoxin system VapC family toxin [Acidobacteriota bacterium]
MTAATASSPVLVDSSGWVEYFGESPKAPQFAPFLEDESRLLVPTIVLYEVRKKLLLTAGKVIADRFLSVALRTFVIALDEQIALASATISIEKKLAMADAIIYATALAQHAEFVTSDQAFSGLPSVTLL